MKFQMSTIHYFLNIWRSSTKKTYIFLGFLIVGSITLFSIIPSFGHYSGLSNHLIIAWLAFLTTSFMPLNWHNRIIRYLLVLFIHLGILVIIVASKGNASIGFYQAGRIQLFLASPNFLASVLVLLIAIQSIVSLKQRYFFLILCCFALYVVNFTGSRAALLAIIALAITFIITNFDKRMILRLSIGSSLTIAVISIIAMTFFASTREMLQSYNLLPNTIDIPGKMWAPTTYNVKKKSLNPSILIDKIQVDTIWQIRNDGNSNKNLIIHQRGVITIKDAPYITSVYLRSDIEQEIFLANHHTSIICSVTSEWRRCSTPVAYGDGHNEIHWRIETKDPQSFSLLEMWGPQLEQSSNISSYQAKFIPPRWYYLINKFDILFQGNFESRFPTWQCAWESFLLNPWLGSGTLEYCSLAQNNDKVIDTDSHAHNLILHMLAFYGILGIVCFTTIVVIIIKYIGFNSSKIKIIAPLIITVGVLNLLDLTIFFYWNALIFWSTLGMLSNNNVSAMQIYNE